MYQELAKVRRTDHDLQCLKTQVILQIVEADVWKLVKHGG